MAENSTAPAPSPAHPAPQGMTIYTWPSGLLMLAPTLVVDRPSSPLGATLRIACAAPYTIETDEGALHTRASLLGPKSGRRRVVAVDSDIAVFYLPVEAPEHAGLTQALGDAALIDLDFARFESLLPELREALTGALDGGRIQALVRRAVHAVTGREPPARQLDPRIEKIIGLLQDLPLCDFSLERLGTQVHLSPSRLRELFRVQTGNSISQYARWQAVWHAVRLWKEGRLLTDIAQEAGFHDMAHLNRAFVEMFGINPVAAIDPRYVRLIRCG